MAVGVQVPLRVPNAGIAQLVEHDLAKVGVASSSLVSRSKSLFKDYGQLITPYIKAFPLLLVNTLLLFVSSPSSSF